MARRLTMAVIMVASTSPVLMVSLAYALELVR